MKYDINVEYLEGVPQERYRYGKPEGVVAHETAVNQDSVARNKRVFGFGGWKKMRAFVHYFVDHTEIWKCAMMDYKAWGSGHVANQRYIHVELCRRDDPDEFLESYKRYVYTLAYCLKYVGKGLTRRGTFWTHREVSYHLGGTDHVDPDGYLKSKGITIDQLVQDVEDELNGKSRFDQDKVKTAETEESSREIKREAEKVAKEAQFPGAIKFVQELGISDGSNPTEPITAERLFSILKNYDEIQQRKQADPKAGASEWAKEPLEWAIENGISDGTRPRDNASREQVIKMLHNDNKRKGTL